MDTTSYWASSATFPRFASLKSDCSVDVVVIGGGITGITAAYLLKQRGHKVALLERGRCGGFDSLNTTGHLTFVTDTRLHKLVEVFGKESAKKAWEAGQAAMAMVASNVKQEGISCEFRWVPGYLHAPTKSALGKEITSLQEDAQLATGFGFPAEYQAAIPNFKTPGVQFNVAKFHIGKYLQALVRTIPGKGSFIFENTEASAVKKNPVKVTAGDHTIHCRHVILATHNPLMGNEKLLSAALLQTKLSLYSSYAIGARIPKNLWPEACFWDTAEPYHYLRIDSHRGYDYAVFGGEDHKTGQEKDTPAVYQRLEEKLHHLIPAAKVDHHWSGQVIETIDGLPYIGPTGRSQFAATGFSGNGLTFGTLGAMMAVDAFERRKNPWASLFAIDRKKYRGAAWNYVKENKDFPYHMVHDRLEGAEGKSLRALHSNQGKILRLKGRKAAAYRDPQGKLTLCSPVCTHLKCIVAWNDAEKTWDCPCHGSRFAPTGEVLSGPAEKPLAPFEESDS